MTEKIYVPEYLGVVDTVLKTDSKTILEFENGMKGTLWNMADTVNFYIVHDIIIMDTIKNVIEGKSGPEKIYIDTFDYENYIHVDSCEKMLMTQFYNLTNNINDNPITYNLKITAKPDVCQGMPILELVLDTSVIYLEFTSEIEHVFYENVSEDFVLEFLNDFSNSECDRNIYIYSIIYNDVEYLDKATFTGGIWRENEYIIAAGNGEIKIEL